MWVRQSGYKANRFFLAHTLTGNTIHIAPNRRELIENDQNTHAVVLTTHGMVSVLFIGSRVECEHAFEKLVHNLDIGTVIAFS